MRSLSDLARQLAHTRSPKRSKNERTGIHAWHPYYAGYAAAFVHDTARILASDKQSPLLLDPWNGSGVTTQVAQSLGLPSAGVEINPVMVIFAKAKSLHLPAAGERILRRSAEIVQAALSAEHPDTAGHALTDWVPRETLATLLALLDLVLQTAPLEAEERSDLVLAADRVVRRDFYDAESCLLLAALFRLLRAYGGFGAGSNPTWIVKKEAAPVLSGRELAGRFQELVAAMLADISALPGSEPPGPNPTIFEGDARRLPLASDSADLIITSPPYCTRIDYAVSTKPELLFMGFRQEEELDDLRRRTMGAPVITDKSLRPRQEWGSTCLQVLEQVYHHTAKASRSYYFPNLVQYFNDAELSMREILRVLRKDSAAAVVVQSSYYKEVEIPLGQIYVELAEQLGGEALIARREVVKGHMAHVNTKSTEYVANKVFYEDVVLIRPR